MVRDPELVGITSVDRIDQITGQAAEEWSVSMRLEDKVALISGGARGQGAVEARLFAREGAKVVIGDLLEDAGKQVEADINASGGECLFVRLDVTIEADWREVVGAAVSRFGRLHILVNNAGIGSNEYGFCSCGSSGD